MEILIKEKRIQLKLSQEKLARIVEISTTQIRNLETGRSNIKDMKLENYLKLIKALQIPITETEKLIKT